MRASVLLRSSLIGLIGLIGLAGLTGEAHAEKVRINQSAKLLARPGEQGKVLLKIKSGEKVTLLRKEGRYLKIRVQGKTGWVPRTKADVPEDDDEISRNTRRRPFVDGRSNQRGSLGDAGPEDRVGEDATGDTGGGGDDDDDDDGKRPPNKQPPKTPPKGDDDGDDDDDDDDDTSKVSDDEDDAPKRKTVRVSTKTDIFEKQDEDSDSVFKAGPDDNLYLMKAGKKWTEVENDEGDIGYVLTSDLERDTDDDDEEVETGPRKRSIELRVRGGVTIITQGLRTAGGAKTVPDNYNVGVSAATIAVGGAYLRPYKKDFVVGVDMAYAFQKAIPGVRYKNPDSGAATTTAFTVHDLGLKLVGGYDLHKKNGLMLLARAGLRYNSFQVADVGNLALNPATIPSEIQVSPTIGGGLTIPKLTPSVGLRFVVDAFVVGTSVTQTKGLEDGLAPSAKGLNFGAMFNYRWKTNLDIQATYDLNYKSMSFGAPNPMSLRAHMGTAVTRTDVFHMLTVGIAKGF